MDALTISYSILSNFIKKNRDAFERVWIRISLLKNVGQNKRIGIRFEDFVYFINIGPINKGIIKFYLFIIILYKIKLSLCDAQKGRGEH